MRKMIVALLLSLLAWPAGAQLPGGGSVIIGNTSVQGGTTTQCLYITPTHKIGSQACGGAPSGAAGGDLAGTYPDPTIKPSVSLTTPNINVATGTSLALGGAVIGTNALAVSGTQALAGGTLTASGSFMSITGTWNNAGVTFPGALLVNLTDTASNASSLLLDLQTGGTTRLRVLKNGRLFSLDSIVAMSGTAIPAGGLAGAGYRFSSTANFGIFFGSGAPTLSAAQGSLYLRSDGTTTNDRAYINTDGATGWASLTTGS